MFRISRFQQLLQPIDRSSFDALVRRRGADKYSKGFGSWAQLVTMVYAQLSGATSLRQIEAGFNAQRTHHYHLGVGAVRRSTLAEANGRRDEAVFAEVARGLMSRVQRRLRREGAELLYLLDSTPLRLQGRGFDQWAAAGRTQRTQGLKLHLQYAPQAACPVWYDMSAPNVNDVAVGRTVPLQAAATYVFDKGYCDYNWWQRIAASGARFVTRFKRNAGLTVLAVQPLSAEQRSAGILADEQVCLNNRHPGGGRRNHYWQQPLRRITVACGAQPPLVLASNDLSAPAEAIAALYRARWQVELYFKWIKQHLRIKRLFGRSERAVRIQILTALIAYLLLAVFQKTQRAALTLWTVLGEVRATLFQRPSLEAEWYRRRRERLLACQQLQPALFP